MNCYVCAHNNIERTAIALCHNCSAAVCADHAIERAQDVVMLALINREVVLPRKARQIVCGCCDQAQRQPRRAS